MNEYKFEDIKIGLECKFTGKITKEKINVFLDRKHK